MATLTTTTLDSSGEIVDANSVAADAGGDKVDPGVVLVVTNGDAGSHTVTLVTPQVVDGDLAVDDRDVAVAAGDTTLIRVPSSFTNPDDGLVDVTYDAVTSVTVQAVR